MWWLLILRIVFGTILSVIIGGSFLFGYIAWVSKARKWSGGIFAIAIVCIIVFYWLILFDPLSVIPLEP